jgi:hypothetical protein
MKSTRIAIALVIVASASASASASAQQAETQPDSTIDLGSLLYNSDHGGLTISSGKTYNRVEGLPVYIGPTYKGRVGRGDLSLAALGIIRSSNKFHWDPENLGHRLTADLRFGRHRGFAVGASTFDEVAKIEPWQLTEPDGGLAAFFLRRDYFDWYGRHGGSIYASAFRSDYASATLAYSSERWASRSERDVLSVFRSGGTWRANPVINDGLVHVVRLNLNFDTRNQVLRPWAGWYLSADYEHGDGNFEMAGTPLGPDDVSTDVQHLSYGRAFFDLRRYNRISPRRQLNGRLVFGCRSVELEPYPVSIFAELESVQMWASARATECRWREDPRNVSALRSRSSSIDTSSSRSCSTFSIATEFAFAVPRSE